MDFIYLSNKNLFETERILNNSNLVVHNAVSKIALLGSRGLQGDYGSDSDIDLGLILGKEYYPDKKFCREVLEISLTNWNGVVELDTVLLLINYYK
jgi:hypothetical protein